MSFQAFVIQVLWPCVLWDVHIVVSGLTSYGVHVFSGEDALEMHVVHSQDELFITLKLAPVWKTVRWKARFVDWSDHFGGAMANPKGPCFGVALKLQRGNSRKSSN